MSSIYQQTKKQLIETIKEKDIEIESLNNKIEEVLSMLISSDALPLDADSSKIIWLLTKRIKDLEQQIG